MFNKFTDAIRWVVDWINNTLPGTLAQVNKDADRAEKSAEGAGVSAENSASSAAQAKQSAQNAAGSADQSDRRAADAERSAGASQTSAEKAAQSAAMIEQKATTTTYGIAMLATDELVNPNSPKPSGTAVIPTAQQMWDVKRALNDVVVQGAPDATEVIKGIAQIATTDEAKAGGNDTDIMTPAKVKAAIDVQRPFANNDEAKTGANATKSMTPAMVKASMDQFGQFGTANYITGTSPVTSMNELTKGGIYYLSTSATQIADRPSAGSVWLAVFGLDTSGYVRQWALDSYSTERKQWIRHKRAGVWDTAWTSYISPQSYTLATTVSNGLMDLRDKQKADSLKTQWFGTEAQYNALSSYNSNTLYFCKPQDSYQITKVFLGGEKQTKPPTPEYPPVTEQLERSGTFTVPSGYNKCYWQVYVEGEDFAQITFQINGNFAFDVPLMIGGLFSGEFLISGGDKISYYVQDMHTQETVTITLTSEG